MNKAKWALRQMNELRRNDVQSALCGQEHKKYLNLLAAVSFIPFFHSGFKIDDTLESLLPPFFFLPKKKVTPP